MRWGIPHRRVNPSSLILQQPKLTPRYLKINILTGTFLRFIEQLQGRFGCSLNLLILVLKLRLVRFVSLEIGNKA
jgi:hypothetical protein